MVALTGSFGSPEAAAAFIAGGVAFVGSVITLVFSTLKLRQSERNSTLLLQQSERKLREEVNQAAIAQRLSEEAFQRQYQLEFAVERVARELLMDEDWRLRSFKVIAHHLSGFGEDELRKILVRAGAIRFDSEAGQELWGLLDRNRDRLGVQTAHTPRASRTLVIEEGDGETFEEIRTLGAASKDSLDSF